MAPEFAIDDSGQDCTPQFPEMEVTYNNYVRNVIVSHCTESCHKGGNSLGPGDFRTFEGLKPYVGDVFYYRVVQDRADMPQGKAPLPKAIRDSLKYLDKKLWATRIKQMVMKKIIAAFLVMMVSHAVIGQTYTSRNAEFTFFSQAPLENIKAESNQGVSALNTNTGEIYFKVKIRSFQFKKGLMQEHFNEKFMESDKYPDAEFKGKINEVLDYKKAGVYPVTVTGDLNIHNVSKEYTAKATLEIKDGLILGQSVFNVRVADHKIKIPRLVFKNIAEVVEVTVSVEYKTNNE